MLTKIESIWTELENDSSLGSGLFIQRYGASVLAPVYVAIRAPEKLRSIAAHIGRHNLPDITNWNDLRDIKVEILNDNNNSAKCYLIFILLNEQHRDIFSVLCEDMIKQVASITEESALIKLLRNRFIKWQKLFEKIGGQGLSEEAQQGLFGELYFLRKFLNNTSERNNCINSWQVPSNKVQDFHDNDWAVEVKTTHGNNHQKIQISSERQLDDTVISNVFLFHLSLDIRNNHGESLNDLVEWLESALVDDLVVLNSFRLKLFEVGYFDVHKPVYKDACYNIRDEIIYKVEAEFPRITENEIRNGVGDVKYSIIVSDCITYIRTEQELFKAIINN